ncbi:MAG: NAD-dependent epimerase/dehydratase family protein [Vicinamibacterales bacterium]
MVYEQDRLFEVFDREKPEVVINVAVLAHGASWTKAWRFYETNVTSLVKMVEGLTTRDYLERFIQVGSSESYGAVDRPADENYPLTPTSPYLVSMRTLVEQVARDLKGPFDDLFVAHQEGSGLGTEDLARRGYKGHGGVGPEVPAAHCRGLGGVRAARRVT